MNNLWSLLLFVFCLIGSQASQTINNKKLFLQIYVNVLSLACTCSGSNTIQATVFNSKLKSTVSKISTPKRNVFVCIFPVSDRMTDLLCPQCLGTQGTLHTDQRVNSAQRYNNPKCVGASSWLFSFILSYFLRVSLLDPSMHILNLLINHTILPSRKVLSIFPPSQKHMKHAWWWPFHLKELQPWLVWLSGLSIGLRTVGSPGQFLVGAHAWVSGQAPSVGCARGNQ